MKHISKPVLLILFIFLLTACQPQIEDDPGIGNLPETEDLNSNTADTRLNDTERLMAENFQYQAELQDVTGGDSSGLAWMKYEEETFTLEVDLLNLPEIDTEKFFYEGWLVEPESSDVISTGPIVDSDGLFINQFISDQNLTDHSRYVLTLEPLDDGPNGQPDPEPAEHILQGTFFQIDTATLEK